MELASAELKAVTVQIDEKELLRKRGYFLRGIIGEGSYSKVREAFSAHLKNDVAIKIIEKTKAPPVFREKFLPREIKILSLIHHPHIIKVFEIFETRRKGVGDIVYIVTEFVKCGDLLEHIKEKGAMDERDCRYVLRDVIDAMTYLHSNNIAHRDVKCENILLDLDLNRKGLGFVAKLCDFGFARKLPIDAGESTGLEMADQKRQLTSTFCGSAAYAAPEVLERRSHDPLASDVWAIGVVAFIMLYGAMPYDDTDISAMIEIHKRGEVPRSKKKRISRPARDVIKTALQYDAKKRPTVSQLLLHTWLEEQ